MLFLPDRSLKVYMNLRTLVSEQQHKVREGSMHAVRFGYGNNTKFELTCAKNKKQPPQVFYKKGKQLCRGLFFNRIVGFGLASLLKKRYQNRCFPLNYARFLRIAFLQKTSRQLFLKNE